MGTAELTAEALTLLIAGSDTTSKSVLSFDTRTSTYLTFLIAPLALSSTTWLAINMHRRSYIVNSMTD